jgi:hypothetical protein
MRTPGWSTSGWVTLDNYLPSKGDLIDACIDSATDALLEVSGPAPPACGIAACLVSLGTGLLRRRGAR